VRRTVPGLALGERGFVHSKRRERGLGKKTRTLSGAKTELLHTEKALSVLKRAWIAHRNSTDAHCEECLGQSVQGEENESWSECHKINSDARKNIRLNHYKLLPRTTRESARKQEGIAIKDV
jgi:hypothetical protein